MADEGEVQWLVTSRIPPESEDLEFLRNKRTGTVHIGAYRPDPRDSGEPLRFLADCSDDEILDAALGKTVMLCGKWLAMCPGGWAEYVSAFPDRTLCRKCVAALGDRSQRAFEHSQEDGGGRDVVAHPALELDCWKGGAR